jgi:class 3 adenylate cyclase
MTTEVQQLEGAIRILEARRGLLGDAVVDTMVAPARARLAALAAAATTGPEFPQTLRQVSILFLDVVGSTALSQQLDPEATGAVMDDALTRATTIVAAHGGRVMQYAGDNIAAGKWRIAASGVTSAERDAAARQRYRVDFGPGYRVYFGRDGDVLVILLGAARRNAPSRRR